MLDSNLDWGQDLYRVPEAVAALQSDSSGAPTDEPISLLYFGHVDPTLYGINYRLISPVPVARLGSIWLLDTRFKTPESTSR